MAKAKEEEVRECKVLGSVNIKGQACEPGDVVTLTEEEYRTCVAAGVPFEGEEPKDAAAVQAAHDEGRKAQQEKLDAIAAEEEEEEEEE